MRIEEAAAILNRNSQTVRKYVRKGVLKHEIIGGVSHVDDADVRRLKTAMETLNPKKQPAK